MPDDREKYWIAFAAFVREKTGTPIELQTRRPYFRLIPIEGVNPDGHAHFAVVATKRRSKVRPAGNRVQLVLEKQHAKHYLAALNRHRSRIEAEIQGVDWQVEPIGEASHIEVWKEHNLDSPAAWPEDFEWLLHNLLLFRRVLGPYVQAARLSL